MYLRIPLIKLPLFGPESKYETLLGIGFVVGSLVAGVVPEARGP